ncbi:protein of unknown function [Methanoculleus bourgensis]|uniref:Uncharacterized protein n=1 Tax=Methanoculleus bourgensis TaxID=83986 RepID=A0A0X8Y018_9EURY|nr:protein of unknown function [Methanoculleus bourgensis]
MLQWSHVFSDMVSECFCIEPDNLLLASMEPCLFRHGKMGCLDDYDKNPDYCFNGAMSFQTW